MNIDRLHPSRRGFLRGFGVSMTLPFMESLLPSGRLLAQNVTKKTGALGPDGQPVRFAGFFMPNGVNTRDWVPKKVGKLKDLPTSLRPLEELKSFVNVITGLQNAAPGHDDGTSAFLTGSRPAKIRDGIANVRNASVDQIIGQALKATTAFSSLELGIGTPGGGTIYRNYISWKNASTPVPFEINPDRAFDRLFKSVKITNAEVKASSSLPNSSVIDAVLEDAKALEKKLGREDQSKLDEYLTSVREVEERIAQQKAVAGLQINDEILSGIKSLRKDVRKHMRDQGDRSFNREPKIPKREYIRLLTDIMALAFWSNSTRSATFCFGNGLHGAGNMSFLEGVSGGHHGISHHGNDSKKLARFTLVNTFFVEEYAYFLNRLESMKEGNSNVLENSIVLLGSNINSGQGHGGTNVPTLLSGHAGGRLKSGRRVHVDRVRNDHLLRSILDLMNVRGDIGSGSKKLRDI